jgi:hypothetical protein
MSAVLGPLHLACKAKVEASHPLCTCQHALDPELPELHGEQHESTVDNALNANLIPHGETPGSAAQRHTLPGADRQGRAGPDGRTSPEMKS